MVRPPSPETKLDWPALIETALTVEGALGNTYNRFYNYSFLNCCLLRMQGVYEPVATYKRWQELGRQVLKGSKAKVIVRPIVIEQKNDDGEAEQRKLRFKEVRCLFGVSETNGDELPPVELPTWDLATALTSLDIRQVPFRELNGNVMGYSVGREIAVSPVAVNPTKTLFHELGHVVLGHTTPEQKLLYGQHRGVMEFQAEATAYLSMNELQVIDADSASHSRGYIQHWLRNERPSDGLIRNVFKATDLILKAGRAA